MNFLLYQEKSPLAEPAHNGRPKKPNISWISMCVDMFFYCNAHFLNLAPSKK